MDASTLPDACVFPAGECRPAFKGMDQCVFEPGSCFYFGTHSPEDDMQTPLLPPDASRPTPAAAPLPPPAAPLPASVAPTPHPVSGPAAPTPVFSPAPGYSPSPGFAAVPQSPNYPQPTGSMVGVPDTAGNDLSKLLPSNGQGNGVTVLLGLLAVAGGGAAWKFYSQRSKEKHEQSMKEIELRAAGNDQQRQKCDANAAANAAAVKDVGARCDDLARKVTDHGAALEAISKRLATCEESAVKTGRMLARTDDLEERLETVERKARRAPKEDT